MHRAAIAAVLALASGLVGAPARAALITADDGQLQCAAAFAIVAGEQQRGVAAASGYPPMERRGREFFVRVMAVRMDAFGLDRAAVEAEARSAVAALNGQRAAADDPAAFMRGIMQGCVPLLDDLPDDSAPAGE